MAGMGDRGECLRPLAEISAMQAGDVVFGHDVVNMRSGRHRAGARLELSHDAPLSVPHSGRESDDRFSSTSGRPWSTFAATRRAGRWRLSRLSLFPNGSLLYKLKARRPDGTSHILLTPYAFLTRLSWLVVRPRMHLTCYHGVLAPNHPWRNRIVPKPPLPLPGQQRCKRSTYDWATLLRRVFAWEVLVCAACGGQRRIVAEIPEGPVGRQILEHLGLPATAPLRSVPSWEVRQLLRLSHRTFAAPLLAFRRAGRTLRVRWHDTGNLMRRRPWT